MTIFLVHVKPFESPFATKMEVFNEATLITLSYGLMMLSKFVPDPEVRYKIGWLYLVACLTNFSFHLTNLIYSSGKQLQRRVKRKMYTR